MKIELLFVVVRSSSLLFPLNLLLRQEDIDMYQITMNLLLHDEVDVCYEIFESTRVHLSCKENCGEGIVIYVPYRNLPLAASVD